MLTNRILGLATAMAVAPLQAMAQQNAADLNAAVQRQDQEIRQLRQQLEATTGMVEELMGAGAPAAGATNVASRTTIGGYGELHYNNLESKNEIDFHRFVLYFGHRFNDSIRFHSELELEHSIAGDGQPGEIELEQAYVDFTVDPRLNARIGLFLMPVGILNEVHEPPTFYGVERNPVETNIVPTTWWEGGAGLYGEVAPGWSYNLDLTSGLNVPVSGNNAFRIRNGRQKVAEAEANDPAVTGRIRWTGRPGMELATTVQYQNDVTQGSTPTSAVLVEAHAIAHIQQFGLRALYARWDLDSTEAEAVGRDVQSGWYVEPSYKVTSKWGLFARYNEWDNEAGSSADTKKKQTEVGVNFWPHPYVVLKADFRHQSGAADDDGFNLGFGYQF